jgi:hypothetical protein
MKKLKTLTRMFYLGAATVCNGRALSLLTGRFISDWNLLKRRRDNVHEVGNFVIVILIYADDEWDEGMATVERHARMFMQSVHLSNE